MPSVHPYLLAATIALLLSDVAHAGISFTAFGPNGEGGSINGQTLTFGTGGGVFELDSFLNVANTDLNGPVFGTSAQLSLDPLPAELTFAFAAELSPDSTDLTLQYFFTNASGTAILDVQFFSFVDAQIDDSINTYFNEAANVSGALGSGATDSDPDSFEVDEPGYVFGDVFDNLLFGALDNTNAITGLFPDDVSLALGFRLGDLAAGDQATVTLLLSEDSDNIGSFAIHHFDTDPNSLDVLTLSGIAQITSLQAIPEPPSCATFALTLLSISIFMKRQRKFFAVA